MKNKKFNYLIILLYGIILTLILIGQNNIYGSNTDWINQHTVITDYFRKLFYETGKFIPNFAFNLGGGQNIFNYSYYGLMSPIILISYLLPFIKMPVYVMIASILLYLSSGLLIYKFLESHKYNNKICLFSSLILLTFTPITYHFHHHIMFVWYLPFLILSFFGVDKFIKENKSFLLIISIFLIILTNYYYSISCLFLIALYGIYTLIKNFTNIKEFIIKLIKAIIAVIIPIMISSFMLIPTAFSIINSERPEGVQTTLKSLFVFNINEVSYLGFSIGLTFIFLLIPFIILSKKKIKPEEIFLSIVLIIITYMPSIMYLLNGMLYVRGKVLIPFIILYIIAFAKCINELKNIDYKKLTKYGIILLIFIIITNYQNKLTLLLIVDSIVTYLSFYFLKKYNKKEIIYIPLLITLLICMLCNNCTEHYVSKNKLNNIMSNEKENLLNTNDKKYHRTEDYTDPNLNANRIYNKNYNKASMYSSNYNHYYRNFYYKYNNLPHRNNLIQAGSENVLFNYLMDVKYVISKNDVGYGYHKIKQHKSLKLYENKDVYDLIYTTNNIGTYNEYNKLKFPYNIEYLMNYPVTNEKIKTNYQTKIKKIKTKKDYSFTLKKDKMFKYNIDTNSKILIITFDMDYNEECPNKEQVITINNVKNKLSCKSWMYHNKNKHFKYIISSNDNINELIVNITKGKYKISNVNIYTYEMASIKRNKINNLKIDKRNSIITGNTNLKNNEYAITSIPYDKNFKIYIDGQKIKYEKVNEAFIGFKIKSGKHNIKIKYASEGFLIGNIISIFGIICMIIFLIYEKSEKKINNLFKKYEEILMYLIFGVLTTLISLITYFILIKSIFNSNNSIQLQIANIISWIVSVLFAYVTNSKYVFNSKLNVKEMSKFYSSRISTLLIDMAIMFIFVSLLHFNNEIIKIIDQFVVIIINYILSKFIVFKGGK